MSVLAHFRVVLLFSQLMPDFVSNHSYILSVINANEYLGAVNLPIHLIFVKIMEID